MIIKKKLHSMVSFKELGKEYLLRSNYKTLILREEIKKEIETKTNSFVYLKKYFNVISGYAFKSKDYLDEGMPLLKIHHIEENNPLIHDYLPLKYKTKYAKVLAKKDDILISLTGSGKLKSKWIKEEDDEKYLCNQRIAILRAKKGVSVNIPFLAFMIQYYPLIKKQFDFWSNGKTQLNISDKDLLKIKIPEVEKEKITKQVREKEKKIHLLEQEIKELKEDIDKLFEF